MKCRQAKKLPGKIALDLWWVCRFRPDKSRQVITQPDGAPDIGSKHIHKGGNVWQVVGYVYVIVELSNTGTKTYVDKGDCIQLRYVSLPCDVRLHRKGIAQEGIRKVPG
jgi:hypothetical protein